MKRHGMIKIMCLVLAVSMLVALAACGGGKTTQPTSSTTTTKTTTTSTTTTSTTSKTTTSKTTTTTTDDDIWDDDDYWDDDDPEACAKPYDAPVRPLDNGQKVEVGNIVTFGSYPQSASGATAPIEWIILDVKDGKALLLSRYVLDSVQYNEEYETTTWETSDIREWLNTVFLKAAFSGAEARLVDSVSKADKAMGFEDADPGNDVTDKVFLLSAQDVINTAYGFNTDWSYGYQDPIRIALPTAYAATKDLFIAESGPDDGLAEWWLRSTGGNSGHNASYIYSDGFVCTLGGYVIHNKGVRPSVWVSLN